MRQTWARRTTTWEHNGGQVSLLGEGTIGDRTLILSGTPQGTAFSEVPLAEKVAGGRLFLNKLMSLTRRHGHGEYAVYSMKLRGRTGATPENFTRSVEVLRRADVVTSANDMVFLTESGASHRFSGKDRPGLPANDDVADFWEPIVQELDEEGGVQT